MVLQNIPVETIFEGNYSLWPKGDRIPVSFPFLGLLSLAYSPSLPDIFAAALTHVLGSSGIHSS